MADRRSARRQALEILYQADVTGADPVGVVVSWREAGTPVQPFAEELVDGVAANRAAIDALLEEAATDWSVERMPSVDRSILRLACYEIRYAEDIPTAVAIDEAVRAAKELSTEDAARFVNGVLGRIARGA